MTLIIIGIAGLLAVCCCLCVLAMESDDAKGAGVRRRR